MPYPHVELAQPYADMPNTYRAETSGGVYRVYKTWGDDWIVMFGPKKHGLPLRPIHGGPFESLTAANLAVDEHAAFYTKHFG